MLFVFAFFIPSPSAGETTISVTAKTENPSHSGNGGLSFKFVFYRIKLYHTFQAPVVQRPDNAIHRINRYPADKCEQNKPRYPLDSDLSGG